MTCAALPLVAALLLTPAAADEPHPIVAAVKAKLKHPDRPFTMVVLFKVKPGKEKEFETLFAEAAKGTRKEKGNAAYDLNRDAEQPDRYAAYEKWKNLDALGEHVKAEYVVKLLKALPELTEGAPELRVLIPVGD